MLAFVKAWNDDVKALLAGLARDPGRHLGRYGYVSIFWLDGDLEQAKAWIEKEKLKIGMAVLPADAETLKAWKLDPEAKTTFIAADWYRVDGVVQDPTLAGFKAALKKATDPRIGFDAVRARMQDKTIPVDERIHAMVAMREHGARAAVAVPALIGLSQHAHRRMRSAALGTLAKVGAKAQASDIEKELLRALGDLEPWVRQEALLALAEFPYRSAAVVPAVKKILTDAEERVRTSAAKTLKQIDPKKEPATR